MNNSFITEEDSSLSTLPMRLTDKKYFDVKFRFGKVAVMEDDKNDQCVLKFDYEILDSTDKYTHQELENSNNFRKHIGDVLADYLSSGNIFEIGKLKEKS